MSWRHVGRYVDYFNTFMAVNTVGILASKAYIPNAEILVGWFCYEWTTRHHMCRNLKPKFEDGTFYRVFD